MLQTPNNISLWMSRVNLLEMLPSLTYRWAVHWRCWEEYVQQPAQADSIPGRIQGLLGISRLEWQTPWPAGRCTPQGGRGGTRLCRWGNAAHFWLCLISLPLFKWPPDLTRRSTWMVQFIWQLKSLVILSSCFFFIKPNQTVQIKMNLKL